MYVTTMKRCIKYWFKVLDMNNTRFVKKCYNMMILDDRNGMSNWASSIRTCLQSLGFGYVWENPGAINANHFMNRFVNRLKDIFLQKWHQSINANVKLEFYVMYKSHFEYELYLDVLDIRKFRFAYVNFKTSCHDLEIERGRYRNIPRHERLCKLCDKDVVEDEYHFLLCCEFYKDLRCVYIPEKYRSPCTMHKFKILMSTRNENLIRNIATYLFHAFNVRKTFLAQNAL